MKKIIQRSLLSAIVFLTAFITPSNGQDATKEMVALAKKFQDAYNRKDDKAIKTIYTDDATRTAADGTVLSGNEAISAEFAKTFADNNITIKIMQEKVVSQADGSVLSTGTYHVTGASKAGEKVDRKGAYTNTVVKVEGHWKIAKSVLTDL